MNIAFEKESKNTLTAFEQTCADQIELHHLTELVKKYPERAIEIICTMHNRGARWIAEQILPILETAERRERVRVIQKPKEIELSDCEYLCNRGI